MFVGDLYQRRWLEQGQATSRVERNGREMTDPVPPGLRLIDDAEDSRRYFARSPQLHEPAVEVAREYFDAKVAATAGNLGFSVGTEHLQWIRRMVFTVLRYDGVMLLENFDAHPTLKQLHADYVASTPEDDVVALVAWWISLSADDPAGGSSMWLHLTMDKGVRLGFEEAGALPRRDP